MSDVITNPATDVAAIRSAMLNDLASIEVFAAAVGRSPRTVCRMVAERKIPIIRIGRTPYVIVSRARDALMGDIQAGPEPVRRGRPRKVA